MNPSAKAPKLSDTPHYREAMQSLALFQALIASMEGPALLLGADGTIVEANHEGRRCYDPTRFPDVGANLSLTPIAGTDHFLAVAARRETSRELMLERARGQWGLTAKQAEILSMVVDGDDNQTIAESLGRVLRTVELHVSALLKKSGSKRRAQLIAELWRLSEGDG